MRCFACDKNLGGWEKGDDPMEEHRRRGATCPFIQAQAAADAAEAAAATAIEEEAGAMKTEVAAPEVGLAYYRAGVSRSVHLTGVHGLPNRTGWSPPLLP